MNHHEQVDWTRRTIDSLRDGGSWAVPRSGLIFTKRCSTLVLTARLPHMQGMLITAPELTAQQDADYECIKRRCESAGIAITDET